MRMNKGAEEENIELNMTPMIDCVFQLMIFFMICIDLTQQDIVVLKLPQASESQTDENPEKNRLTININKKGEIMIRRTPYTIETLKPYLADAARLDPDLKNRAISNVPVLIRCDKDAEFKKVQEVMQACATPGIRIWKILIASKKEGEE